ncbi:MAG: hypothetical protein E5W75_09360 [Mesorhizobium sp.]|nr:MAG: hypothetical protein E5W75_09360 [Mesorhizobium sp.]
MTGLFSEVFLSALLFGAVTAAIPLLLAGLGEQMSEKAGVLNIGIEGMMLAGAYLGFVGAFYSGSLWLGFLTGAAGGIAVALMGRLHPVGIVLAAILFGMLYQGGAELAFEMPAISRDMIVIIQGLVILFAGALEHMFRPYIQALFASFSPKSVGMQAVNGKGA